MSINTFQRPNRASLLAILLAAAVLPVTMMLAASTNTISAATNNQSAAATQSLEFMPEIERVLRSTDALGERCYLDFEGGTVATERRAENPQLNRQLHRDLKADLTPGAEQWTGVGLQLTPATDELWNAPADQVIATLAEHLADAPPTLPVTRASWLFKTADGNYGLMREEGMVQTPGGGRGMKITYKMARAALNAPPLRNGAQWIVRPVKVAAKELPLPERIKLYVTGEPATTGYALEIWEQGPGSEMRLRDDLTRQRIPGGEVFYLKAQNRFYIQWDGGGASTLHYYGPFAGDPVKVLGLAETNTTPVNGTNQAPSTGAANAANPPANLVPANLPVIADIRSSVVDDETGAAVTDFWVQQGMANPDKPGEIIWSQTYLGPTLTGSPGRFTVQARKIGQSWRVLADGYLPEPVPEHPDDANMRPVNTVLRLKRGGEVHGVVLDSMARSVTGARVFLATEQTPTFTDGKPQNTFRGSSATTDARGHFTLSGVGATEPKVIAVSPDGFRICPAPKYRPGEELKVTLPKPATLTVRYDIADDAPEAQLHLMLRDSGPGISGMNEWNPKVANGGQIVLTNLAPGTYDFARSKAGVGFRYEHRRLMIEAGRTQNVDLVRTNGFPIHGEVTGLADTQAPGARIYIGSPEDTGSLRWEWHLPVFDVETCGKDGQFQTARLSPGNYTISVEAFEPEAPQFATNGGRRVQVVYSGLRLPTYTGTARVTVTAEAAPAPVRIELHPRADAGARR